MKTLATIFLLLISACSYASDEQSNYVSIVDCGSQSLARANEVGKLYEPYPQAGIIDLAYSLDKTYIGNLSSLSHVIDSDGRVRWTPAVALKINSGWLVGSFNKLNSGELVYLNVNKGSRKILGKPVFDIFQTPLGVFVITTVDVFGNFKNEIHYLAMNHGDYKPIKLFTLPAPPVSAWGVDAGGILVNTEKASFILSNKLELQRVECKNKGGGE